MIVTDEKLSAYLDGELDRMSAIKVEAALAKQPEVQARLDQLRRANTLVKQHISSIDARPLPESVKRLLPDIDDGHADDESDRRVATLARRAAPAKGMWQLPIAASIALALGFAAGVLSPWQSSDGDNVAGGQPLNQGSIKPGSALYAAFESAPSGSTVSLSDDESITAMPSFTFRGRNGRYCREMLVTGPETASRSVACRDREPVWTIVIVSPARMGESDNYTIAADDNRAILDRAIQSMVAEAPLDLEDERSVIKSGWRTPDPKSN